MTEQENKKIVIIEDSADVIKMTQGFIEELGWTVVAVARTLDEAQALVPQLTELGVGYALVDGNLSNWETSGRDGLNITRQIHQQAEGVKVIGFSSTNPQPEVDFQMGKWGLTDKLEAILLGNNQS